MKSIIALSIITILFYSCKEEKRETIELAPIEQIKSDTIVSQTKREDTIMSIKKIDTTKTLIKLKNTTEKHKPASNKVNTSAIDKQPKPTVKNPDTEPINKPVKKLPTSTNKNDPNNKG